MSKKLLRAVSLLLGLVLLVSITTALFTVSAAGEETLLTDGETQYNGVIPVTPDFGDRDFLCLNTTEPKNVFVSDRVFATSLPSSYDARDYISFPSVKNQGSSGACWAFSTIAAMEIDSVAQGYYTSAPDFSESHLVWFAYSDVTAEHNICSSNPYSEGGNWLYAQSVLSGLGGCANESDFPFNSELSDYSDFGNYSLTDRYDHSSGIIADSTVVFTDVDSVKNWIMVHGSVTVNMNFRAGGFNTDKTGYYSTRSDINHMVCIVGWDDNYSKSNFASAPSTDGAWLVRNSLLDDGKYPEYFWVSYKSKLSDFVGFSVRTDENIASVYSYNTATMTEYKTVKSGSSVANVYTINSDETPSSVSFYVVKGGSDSPVNVKATCYLYDGKKSDILCSASATYSRAGWFTLDFDTDEIISAGTRVMVELTYTSDGDVNIPVEPKAGTYSSAVYTSKAGCSYCMFDGATEYSDMTSCDLGDAYVNLYTVSAEADSPDEPGVTCTCKCHKDGISGFIFKILCFLWRIFGKTDKRICECGAYHW